MSSPLGARIETPATSGKSAKAMRNASAAWGWACVLVLIYEALVRGIDERRVHMLNVYYQAPTVATQACLMWAHNLRVWHRLRLTPSPLICFGVEQNESVTFEHVYRLAHASALALLPQRFCFCMRTTWTNRSPRRQFCWRRISFQ